MCSRIRGSRTRSRRSGFTQGSTQSIAQQLDTGTVHKLREEFTTGSDEDACYLLDGEDKKMYFMCSSPPDNPNMYCEEMADGMDWVCVVEDDAFTRDLLDDFSA